MRKILKMLIIGFGAIACYIFVAPLILRSIGYYPDGVGWKVAQQIVAVNGQASDCMNIIHTISHPFSPTEGEQRSSCIYDYASLMKDPSACELLMPSSYGLSCVGGATKFLPCLFDDKKNVIWNDGKRQEVPFSECSRKKLSEQGNACCQAAASRFTPEFIEGCEAFRSSNPLLADQCQYEVALKEIDPVLCATIEDENLQSACSLEVTTLLKNPELRSNYPFVKQR